MGDVNADGRADVAVALSGVAVFLGRADGTLAAQRIVTSAAPGDIVIADLNGNGNGDLVLTTSGGVRWCSATAMARSRRRWPSRPAPPSHGPTGPASAAAVVGLREAAAHGEVVVNATPGSASLDVLGQVGAEPLAGKILIDIALAVTPKGSSPTPTPASPRRSKPPSRKRGSSRPSAACLRS